VIDTASIGEITPEIGDEIAVFDGDLCVGAAAYPDSFPVILAAWKDDIATSGVVDGYWDGNEMTFKWFDQSENAEITFIPPPGTYSMAGGQPIAAGVQTEAELPQSVQRQDSYSPGIAATFTCQSGIVQRAGSKSGDDL